ncbi:hypothetical protein MSAN_01375400 [Mycena sanguinolenta]|uniref:DUF6534 domain-containing protein n=1 Tax=Mycena sanguinolenta TaxID=230812 RepID=A0A8H6YAP0_9AGAR|nr:hypothetical protein MSAN_01375400 [Mycena sanguinolenta]
MSSTLGVPSLIPFSYFVSRIHKLTKGRRTKFSLSAFGIYLIILLAVVQIVAGIVQTVWSTNSMVDMLIHDAITRGVLTSVSSGVNMILFLALPNTFWFFLGLAPNIYMNSMLATLNSRQHIRDKVAANDKGWNSIPMATLDVKVTTTFAREYK